MENPVRSRASRLSDKNSKGTRDEKGKTELGSEGSSWIWSGAYVYYVLMPLIVLVISAVLTYLVANTVSSSQPASQKHTGAAKPKGNGKGVLLTAQELANHDGSDPNIPIYIVVLGRIYNVEKGRRHYAPGSGYNVFAGRDSSPSFVTGAFSREEATDDVSALSPEEIMGVKEWMEFYRKDYTYVGRLIGRYYDQDGKPTEALKEAKEKMKEGQRLRKLQQDENKRYPGCNSRWSADEGSTVWCTKESAGIHRDWAGVPRKYFKPGKKDSKCVCVRTTGPASDTGDGNEGDLNNANMREYPGCGKYDAVCKVQT